MQKYVLAWGFRVTKTRLITQSLVYTKFLPFQNITLQGQQPAYIVFSFLLVKHRNKLFSNSSELPLVLHN